MSEDEQKRSLSRKGTIASIGDSSLRYLCRKVNVPFVRVIQSGANILRNPKFNKGLAFTAEERNVLRIGGLLPAQITTQDEQLKRCFRALEHCHSPLEKYQYLQGLAGRNHKLFYRLMNERLVELMPVVYTPTVGKACRNFGHIFRETAGLYISLEDKGSVLQLLYNWPEDNVRGIVFTDGERILGLGDLGAHGMGIPIGKLQLYTACAGIDPELLLPVCIDVGTNNEEYLEDPLYTGLRQKRERSDAYDQLIEEFIEAVKHRWGPNTLLQWEDFGNRNAFRLLEHYKDRCCTFNDDIQGTASVVLGGVIAAARMLEKPVADNTFVVFGAGEAGLGIANLIATYIATMTGCDITDARAKIFMVDSRGLITKDRPSGGINSHKAPFAHEFEHHGPGLAAIVKAVKATALIGVTAQPKTFTEEVVKNMAANTERPIIFPLSNPTDKAECTALEAYTWTEGKCVFASGSPFDPVEIDGKTYIPGQGNNAYIFPGLALAIIECGARRVTDNMMTIAAEALSDQVTAENIEEGRIYPPLSSIREVSIKIATRVAAEIYSLGLATIMPRPDDLENFLRSRVFSTDYYDFV